MLLTLALSPGTKAASVKKLPTLYSAETQVKDEGCTALSPASHKAPGDVPAVI